MKLIFIKNTINIIRQSIPLLNANNIKSQISDHCFSSLKMLDNSPK